MRSEADSPERDAETLDDIARRIERLTISRRDPDRFFEERSEIAELVRKEAWKRRVSRPPKRAVDSGKR